MGSEGQSADKTKTTEGEEIRTSLAVGHSLKVFHEHDNVCSNSSPVLLF